MGGKNTRENTARHLTWLPRPQSWKAALLQLILVAALSVVVAGLSLKIQPNSFAYMMWQFRTQPLLILLNFLPTFLIMLFLSSLIGNVFYGAAVTDLLVCGFSLANLVKCNIRREPLYPRDLNLLREAGEAVSSYHIDLPMKKIAAVLFLALVLFAMGLLLVRWSRRPIGLRGGFRWGSCGLSVVAAVILIFTLFHSRGIYTSFTGTDFFNPLAAYNGLGFTYSFCHYLTTNSIDKPEGFDKEEAIAWDEEETASVAGKPVNVVIVMSETFTDMTDDDAFTYSEEDDPIAFYHSMVARDDVLSGHLVVMNLGGGTANTEFDVMTGIQTDSLSRATSVAYRTMDHNIDSIFRLYGAAGYRTSYIHPGNRWFYNRNHVMPWFGVQSTTFLEDLTDAKFLGDYVSDETTTELLINQFEKDTADGSLVFNYTTTIQNHMNYTLDKYGRDYDLPPLQCRVTDDLPEENRIQLEVYIEGLRYADASLERMVGYFETCGEPVLFVFFGDHLPFLGEDNLGFRILGMEGEDKEYDFSLYEPPFFIWANEEAKDVLDWEKTVESVDLSSTFSACYLGAAIAEITGLSDNSPWCQYINTLRREYPVVWENEFMTRDGSILYELDQDGADQIAKWRKWAYYRLRHKHIADS